MHGRAGVGRLQDHLIAGRPGKDDHVHDQAEALSLSDRLGVMSALYIALLQLGTIVPAFVAVPLADATSWRESIGLWAFFGFAAALPWLLIVRDRRGHDRLPHRPAVGLTASCL